MNGGAPSAGFRMLAIETSADETAAAVVVDGRHVASSVVSSQIDLHTRFGGIVPEISSRAHLELLTPVVAEALVEAGIEASDRPDAVAATVGPGLVGALLVGVSAAKGMALAWGVPFVGVNHLDAHIVAGFVEEPDLEVPMVSLLVSGGHTMLVALSQPPGDESDARYRLLGQTVDDAAGEAFDKVARAMGLGYPGGPAIDRLATQGDPQAVAFPRAMRHRGYDFSFSGLKTAVVNYLRANPEADPADVAASFQMAVVDILIEKTERAALEIGARSVGLGGGVAANSILRERMCDLGIKHGWRVALPSRTMCTDNAAMVGAAGWWKLRHQGATPLTEGAQPGLGLPVA